MGGLVCTHLPSQVLPQYMHLLKERLLLFRGFFNLALVVVQSKRRGRLLQLLFACIVRKRRGSVQLVYQARGAGQLNLNCLQSALLALLRMLPHHEHCRKWESKGHR
jgi:hypothetical protein